MTAIDALVAALDRAATALIAAGQTLGNLAAAVAFVVIAQRRVGGLPLRHVLRLHVRLVLVSALAALATWGAVVGLSELLGTSDGLALADLLDPDSLTRTTRGPPSLSRCSSRRWSRSCRRTSFSAARSWPSSGSSTAEGNRVPPFFGRGCGTRSSV